ncbi:uncharacterized protein LOC109862827 isoform X2 [Pseudomyrmex gracilis]|nr:uncharacterized protein LOC109862827 isoform X2 [Pseudomyrmex gracilis]
MIETNCGEFYTLDYCQKRCTSLREQYNREKKQIENQFRSGSAAPNSSCRQFPFFSQMTFLDKIIKRRSTYSNVKSQSNASIAEKNVTDTKTYESNNISASNKENQSTSYKHTVNAENFHQEVSIHSLKLKRGKMNETKELEQTFIDMSKTIKNYMETSKSSTADNAFMEFIKIQFDSVPEHEKNIRRKLIIDTISAPLPKM